MTIRKAQAMLLMLEAAGAKNLGEAWVMANNYSKFPRLIYLMSKLEAKLNETTTD